ncbi:Tripartite tricarboxylate transporter TctB family protein [Roseovarius sp. THAF8]|uniref:tripartite tricarboxylate transporter TctB family protein n=1 Tax=Roseovarius sp. THAF8 TaxID=2587846 RepID=UPI001268A506|nr:tripartite tricarboxylate transporter TctB family protein [Roseovarius sp. THAF8]QFT96904.1 Tripartite tricarboxylate transporter TctB family protein [Roseovarius sp. THAF8]
MERRQDIVLGTVFAALGIFAAVKAAAYSGASGTYPMVLGLVLSGFGLLVGGRGVVRGRAEPRPLTNHTGRVFITVAIGAVYLAIVPILGFYTASALVVLALPVALGFRQPVLLALATAVFIGIVWAVFSIVLEKPLPTEFWQTF